MENEEELIKLLIAMIDNYKKYGDKIGYTKPEIDKFIDKYELIDLEYSPEDSLILYENNYLTKNEFDLKILSFLEDAESGNLDRDTIEFVEFLENNNLINICIEHMRPNNIRKDDDGNWYFYARDGWSYFADYFKNNTNRDDVVKTILNGNGYELFDYYDSVDKNDFKYLDIKDSNLKIFKDIIQKMKNDFEIDQDEIDDIDDIEDVYSISVDYDLGELKNVLEHFYSRAQCNASENEAYEYVTELILDHFNLTIEGLKWVKSNTKSDYDDTLKIKFNSESGAEDTILILYKIENAQYEDDDDNFISYSPPYNGFLGDANKYIDEAIEEESFHLDDIDDKYLP
jgi:hypothetical protein